MTHVDAGSRARMGRASPFAHHATGEATANADPPVIGDAAPTSARERTTDAAPIRDAQRATLASMALPPWARHGTHGAYAAPQPNGPRLTSPPTDDVTAELSDLARRKRRDRSWDPAMPLSEGRNAHHTNTREQMESALTHPDDYNWLEGDVRVDASGAVVLAHDAESEGDGLTFEQWVEIGREGERGVKVDFKDRAAIPKVLDSLDASGIKDGRIMFNFGSDIAFDQLDMIRSRFPGAWIALNPGSGTGRYDDESLDRTVAAAEHVGGKVTFPLRWDIATDDAIDALKSHGPVSIWTSDGHTPDDRRGETRSLRERGVRGMIDLGPTSGVLERFSASILDGLVIATGNEDPIEGARDIFNEQLNDLKDPKMLAVMPLWPVVVPGKFAWQHGSDIMRGADSIADDGMGAARDLASKVPVVGGLFD